MSQNVVAITGANRGIGFEIVKSFHSRGDRIIALCQKKSPQLSELKIEIIEDINLLDKNSIDKAFRELLALNTEINTFIHNAGIFNNDSIGNISLDSLEEQLYVNALSPLMLSQKALPLMAYNSKLVFITSRMGSITDNNSGGYYGYRMSKATLNMMAKGLSIDLKDKCSVGIFHPGYVKTKMTNFEGEITPEEAAKNLLLRIDNLSFKNSGKFFHSNGEELPW